MTIPNFAPGCFGSALAFQDDHPVCKSCVFRQQCEPQHEANLVTLRLTLGVVVAEPKPIIPPMDDATVDPAALALPKKVRELVHRLDHSNLNIIERLGRGENPFETTLPFLRIFCHLLLRAGTVNRSTLQYACETKLNWNPGTAMSHSRMAFQALEHVGAIEIVDGAARLRRS